MRYNTTKIRFVMEAADDAPLSYLGLPDKILTYSTLKSWFLQTTPKALVLSSFITVLIIILFLVEPKDWPIGDKILCCLMPIMIFVPFTWIVSFMYGYRLPKRVKRRFDEITEYAFLGFERRDLGPGYMLLLGDDEEWRFEFYQMNGKNMMTIQAIFKSRSNSESFSKAKLNELLKSFCQKRYSMIKNKPLTKYVVNIAPYSVWIDLPMSMRLTSYDYRYLRDEIKAFISSISIY